MAKTLNHYGSLRGGKRIQFKHIKKFEICLSLEKKQECDIKVKEKEKEILALYEPDPEYESYYLNTIEADTSEPKNCEPSNTSIIQNPEKLSKRIKCDKNNNESDQECIQKLQGLLQAFIDVDPKLQQKPLETLYGYEDRLKYLVVGTKQDLQFCNNLYDRCESGVVRGFG